MMNEVIREATDLIQRSEASTRKAIAEEIYELKEKLGENFPFWLKELMTAVPICNSNLVIPIENEDFNIEIKFLSPKLIIEESLKAVPGCAVFDKGYICIGLIEIMGNPVAINIYEGNNPPVYLLDHDYGENTELIIENKQLIARSLTELLSLTILERK